MDPDMRRRQRKRNYTPEGKDIKRGEKVGGRPVSGESRQTYNPSLDVKGQAVKKRMQEEAERKQMERLMAQQNSSLSASGMMGGAEYGQDNKWHRNISSNEIAKNKSSSQRIRDVMRQKKDRVR